MYVPAIRQYSIQVVIIFGSIVYFDSRRLFDTIIKCSVKVLDGFNFGSAKTNPQMPTLIPCQLFQL